MRFLREGRGNFPSSDDHQAGNDWQDRVGEKYSQLWLLWETVQTLIMLGKSPEVIFYNADNEELERIPIDKMTREELNQLMVDKGIEKKEAGEKGSQHDEI